MTTVYVKGLEFYAFHGVTEEERAVGHRLRLSISAEVEETAGKSDLVHETLDYGKLASFALEVASRSQSRTLEHVVDRLGEAVLMRFPICVSVEVELEKIAPPLPFTIEAVGVRRRFTHHQVAP
jgi:dihydroneopterin aldolase